MEPRIGLAYDDVLLIPQRSGVDSRAEVDISTRITSGVSIEIPVLSAPMDTVTEAELARVLGDAGGLGLIHRFMRIEDQAAQVRAVASEVPVGAAVGVDEDYLERTQAVLEAGAACVVVDVAHGHLEKCLDAVERITDEFGIEVVAGNVATPAGVRDLYAAGAACVKVGIGPGSHCITRLVTGVGVPQFTAVQECGAEARDLGIRSIADGGVRSSGDAVKALLAGADAVMMGAFFAGTDEAPSELVERDGRKYKRTRGMATREANEHRSDKTPRVFSADEGVVGLTPYRGPAGEAIEEFVAGIRSGLSYCGGETIERAREHAEFIRVTANGKAQAGPNSLFVSADADAGSW